MSVTRRNAMLGGASALALVTAAAKAQITGSTQSRPNIVFILADDLGYADVSCYGRTEYKTPNIDALAADGMRFTRAYANSAVCSATRTALMTGRYQYRLPVGLGEPVRPNAAGLSPDVPTLPSLLKAAGYHTALIGKWHLGLPPEYGPLKSGYEHFYGIYGGASDYFRHTELMNDDKKSADKGYLTDLLGDEAVSTVRTFAKTDKPFFISLHFNAPHWPWEGPGDKAESDRLAGSGMAGIMHYDGGSMKTYAAMVTRMDYQIGRVIAALKDAGLYDNSIVIFTSDNGGERYSDTWPFTGKKTELLEGGLRIPAIVRWPNHVPAGSASEQAIVSMDWLPTLMTASGVKSDPQYPSDGMDLMATLTGRAKPVPRTLFWRYNSKDQEAAMEGDWKYLKILGNTFLFNVVDDPLERANMKIRRADIYNRLVSMWQAWNATMLPYTPDNLSAAFSGDKLADHFGAPRPIGFGQTSGPAAD